MQRVTGRFRDGCVLGLVLSLGVCAAEVGLDKEAHEEASKRGEVDQVEVYGESLTRGIDAGNVLVLGAVHDPVYGVSVGVEQALYRVLVVHSVRSRNVRLMRRNEGGAGHGNVLCKTLITGCAVDKLPQESESWASRSGQHCRSGFGDRRDSRRDSGCDGGRLHAGSDLLGDLVCDRDWDSVRDEEVDGSEAGTDKELGDLHCGEGSLDEVGHAVAERRERVVGVL